MAYLIKYGAASDAVTKSGLTIKQAAKRARELSDRGAEKVRIFDDDGDPVDLRWLELQIQSVSFG